MDCDADILVLQVTDISMYILILRSTKMLMCVLLLNTHPFNGPFSRTTRVGRYQKGKTNLDFTEARDSEWQWHQLFYY